MAKEVENLKLVRAVTGHPNLVTVMDVWLIAGYLVTRWELSQEGSLQDLLHRYQENGKAGISVKRALKYCYDAAEAIDFLNDQGIYHRGIKPQNLLLFHGRVKVADLGLAKFAGASTVSHTGSETFGYRPPTRPGTTSAATMAFEESMSQVRQPRRWKATSASKTRTAESTTGGKVPGRPARICAGTIVSTESVSPAWLHLRLSRIGARKTRCMEFSTRKKPPARPARMSCGRMRRATSR